MFLRVIYCRHAPTQRGGIAALPNLGKFLSIYAYKFCRRTTKFVVVTHVERVYWASRASHPKIAEFQRSPILGVLPYLCLHHLTQNDQIRHGSTYLEGRVLDQRRLCICINASRGLSAIAEFLVFTEEKVVRRPSGKQSEQSSVIEGKGTAAFRR